MFTIILVIFRIVCPPEPGAKAEIGELDVPHLVNEDVVRLDVPVDEPHLMNAVHGADKFTDIKPANSECNIVFTNQRPRLLT